MVIGVFVYIQNCDKKQYLFPQLGGGITQPHVIQRSRILIFSSHNHKQWTRQASGSMMHSFLRPVTNRCANVDPVLERETDLEEVTIGHHVCWNTHTTRARKRRKGYCKIKQDMQLVLATPHNSV